MHCWLLLPKADAPVSAITIENSLAAFFSERNSRRSAIAAPIN